MAAETIYLDYAADTPACGEALAALSETARAFPANPNSAHAAGRAAAGRLRQAAGHIAALLGVQPEEIIFTSGATESNNLALKGAAGQLRKYGRHILSTPLEHSSVSGTLAFLQNAGFEVELLGLRPDGQVDLAQLREKLREDTVLVSVCAVDSEIGLRQPVAEIAALLNDRPHCLFHVDGTQAVGKIPVSLEGVDLFSFSPHKFFGVGGVGVLVKKRPVLLETQMHGGISASPFRSGTPPLPLIASAETALALALAQREASFAHVSRLSAALRTELSACPFVHINSTARSVPHILNFSIRGARGEAFQAMLSDAGIYVSTKSACCAPGTVSRPVLALTGDRRAALSTLRVSLSGRTEEREAAAFLEAFSRCCKTLIHSGGKA